MKAKIVDRDGKLVIYIRGGGGGREYVLDMDTFNSLMDLVSDGLDLHEKGEL
jgi:hypothetical protein